MRRWIRLTDQRSRTSAVRCEFRGEKVKRFVIDNHSVKVEKDGSKHFEGIQLVGFYVRKRSNGPLTIIKAPAGPRCSTITRLGKVLPGSIHLSLIAGPT